MSNQPISDRSSGHLSADEILDYLHDEVPEFRRAIIETHITNCDECGDLASQVGKFSRDWDLCLSSVIAPTPAAARRIRSAREQARVMRKDRLAAEARAREAKTVAEQTTCSSWPTTVWADAYAAGEIKYRDTDRVRHFLDKYEIAIRAYVRGSYANQPKVLNNMDALITGFRRDCLSSDKWIAQAIKRDQPFREIVKESLNQYITQASGGVATTKDAASFAFNWSKTLVETALESTESTFCVAEEERIGGKRIWEVFRACVIDPVCLGIPQPGYDQLVKELGLRSPMELLQILATGRKLYQRCLTKVVSELENDDKSATTELEKLNALLAAA